MSEIPPAAHGASAQRHIPVVDVCLVLVSPTGEVLFRQRPHPNCRDGLWDLPCCQLEAGESVLAALIRHARETIGVTIDEENAQFAHIMHSSSDGGRLVLFFVVQRWAGKATNLEPDAYSEVGWFPLSTLPYDLVSSCRAALEWIVIRYYFSLYGW
jgi:8-oxo-dGTP diphosphatase